MHGALIPCQGGKRGSAFTTPPPTDLHHGSRDISELKFLQSQFSPASCRPPPSDTLPLIARIALISRYYFPGPEHCANLQSAALISAADDTLFPELTCLPRPSADLDPAAPN
jgi:hypothetical protein